MENIKIVDFCIACPLFDGFAHKGMVSSQVICRITKPELLMLHMGKKYPDKCPLPLLLGTSK